jgi:hypothetical protein
MMQGERRHPKASFFGLWIGASFLLFTLLNVHFGPWPGHFGQKFYGLPFILDLFGSDSSQPIWGSKHVYSKQDWALLFISISAFSTAWWGNRLRPQMAVPDAMDESTMREAIEGQSISVSSGESSVNPTTASIVAGIVGQMAAQSDEEVSGAIGALSKGEFGEGAARIVSERPKVEGLVDLKAEGFGIPLPEGEHAQTTSGQFNQIPLPSVSHSDEEKSAVEQEPENRDIIGGMEVFSSGTKPGVAPEVIIDSPIKVAPSPPALPSLDELDDDVDEEEAPSMPSLPSLPGLPSLPYLDD